MNYLYRPSGKALEYGNLALNLYRGCSGGCTYCFAPATTFQSREDFAKPKPRAIRWEGLKSDLTNIGKGKSIFLSFTHDPYLQIEMDLKITLQAIMMIQDAGCSANLLTKGGARSTRDFDLLSQDPGSKYGATLTFLDDSLSLLWEPGAALPHERILALQEAHSLGISTWASLEPVIDPAQSLQIIRETAEFVDEFKIGRWNHDSRANLIEWKAFGGEAVELCRKLGKKAYIKKDLQVFLD